VVFNNFLTFSDAAKFADIARTYLTTGKYGQGFTFWTNELNYPFNSSWIPPVTPFSIAFFFKIFGIGDFAVLATSLFYFALTLVFVFLLAKKIFDSKLTALLSTLAVGSSPQIIMYATTGASESPFAFEIVACAYFISVRKKWGTLLALLLLVLMYFTRPQAFIYIAGLVFFYLLDRFKLETAVRLFLAVLLAGLLVDRVILTPLNGKDFLYSIISRGEGGIVQDLPGTAVSDTLRGSVTTAAYRMSPILVISKKVFYNLYNFYKLLPDIMNPYLFALFVIGLFVRFKKKIQSAFRLSAVFIILVTFAVAALSIPFFRYIHPIIPLVYILAVGTLIEFVSFQLSKKTLLAISSTLLILFFAVGQTIGAIFLDSRFEKGIHNTGQPPVYAKLSRILRDNTAKTDLILTNLDTWGTWYGERRTVWFPHEPSHIVDPTTGEIPLKAIYLTSYLIDDENYYMGPEWRSIFDNPADPEKWSCDACRKVAEEFELKGVYKVTSDENYERLDASAVLLVKKSVK
jgi:4-amino-4-deoxy-L-arabinose transferase-like glycosyltransferase